MTDEKIKAFAFLAEKSATAGTLCNIVFHSPKSGDMLKAKGTLRSVSGEDVVQFETSLTEGRVSQKNVKLASLSEEIARLFDIYTKADLNDSGGSASLMISKKGAVTLLKKGKIGEGGEKATLQLSNNREKKHLLDGSEPFLVALGVSDENGRVHDKRQSKFRQICRFAEYICDAEKKLKKNGTLYVCDLCCGKSYLSFAVYHYFSVIKGREVVMEGVDLKPDVIAYCNDVATRVGFTGLTFTCGDVGKYETTGHVHMVLSLHACDIATDLVLERALHWEADVILSTPCCHHWLNHHMNCPTLSFIADYSMLRQKLCDAATDAMRLKLLEANGYEVAALELIDPEETPKNVMLRGIRSRKFDPNGRAAAKARAEYEAARAFLVGSDRGPLD